jgi:tetratricopeptide (TPR) repeat protein
MFEQINALIDKREQPGNLDRAVELLLELRDKHPEKDIIRGKLAHAFFYKGHFTPEGNPERERAFEQGMNYGKEAVTLYPRAVYGNYWYAANLGSWGLCHGIMASLKSIDPMRKSMDIVLKENEDFFFCGPHRVLGRLFHQAPGWPISIGNKNKASHHLERAVERAPTFMHNRLYLSEFYLDTGKKNKAREHLDWMIETPLHPDHEQEDGEYKEQAQQLRRRFF